MSKGLQLNKTNLPIFDQERNLALSRLLREIYTLKYNPKNKKID